MKKIILSAGLLLAAATFAGAQNMYDAINFSRNDYYGTARSMALGNAVTALGGDLGMVGINPAGSAVAPYSQFTITPGLTISAATSSYSIVGEQAMDGLYAPRFNESRANLPNIGLSFNVDMGRRSGLKSMTFAILNNQTNNYNFYTEGFATNDKTSIMGEFAASATGIPEADLAASSSFMETDLPWDILTGYQGGMFGTLGNDGEYYGVTETLVPSEFGDRIQLLRPLAQSSVRSKRGSKNDLIMNVGFNFSDKFYLGFNIGMPMARYRYSESFSEAAVDPSRFVLTYADGGETCFSRGTYNYQYTSDIGGVYGKVGIILRPDKGLRLGASFQTPTLYTVTETWQYFTQTTFTDSRYNDQATSPRGEYAYELRSPYVASFGAAATFDKSGFISIDYELTDYSVMRFRELHGGRLDDNARFAKENSTNKHFAGVSHSVRIGADGRVTPEWFLRGGFNCTTSPERFWTTSDGSDVTADGYAADYDDVYAPHIKNLVTPHYYNDKTYSWSAGFGYSSPGSFFMDAAVRMTRHPASTFAPYYDYIEDCDSPRMYDKYDLWNVSLTMGWRF